MKPPQTHLAHHWVAYSLVWNCSSSVQAMVTLADCWAYWISKFEMKHVEIPKKNSTTVNHFNLPPCLKTYSCSLSAMVTCRFGITRKILREKKTVYSTPTWHKSWKDNGWLLYQTTVERWNRQVKSSSSSNLRKRKRKKKRFLIDVNSFFSRV